MTKSLNDIIARAIVLLNPAQADVSVAGHGDAHNGNVFFRKDDNPPSMLYFDPAFAGRHHPLLDLTKPLFHNVFAMWMYYPEQKQQASNISIHALDETWHVNYDYELFPSREMFLESKMMRTLVPILIDMQNRGQLREDWRAYLKAALFCCPFLTMNLADDNKFPPEISLLGLVMAVEMGSESKTSDSLIDNLLNLVEGALSANQKD